MVPDYLRLMKHVKRNKGKDFEQKIKDHYSSTLKEEGMKKFSRKVIIILNTKDCEKFQIFNSLYL